LIANSRTVLGAQGRLATLSYDVVKRFVLYVFINLHCTESVCLYYGRRVCGEKYRIIKYFETETETSKFVHFAEIFFKNVLITSDLNFFQISGIFPTCFGCFLPANTTKKIFELKKF